jgi:uncharacterized protein
MPTNDGQWTNSSTYVIISTYTSLLATIFCRNPDLELRNISFRRRRPLIAEIDLLISLQETDIEIKRCRAEVAALPTRRETIEQNFAASVKEFLTLKAELDTASTERRRLEEDVAEEQAKHEKFKNDLMKATNEKQYTTAVREIDATKKTVSTLETEILKLMEKIEKLEAQVNERSPVIEAKRAEVDKQITEMVAAVEADQQKLTSLTAQRQELIAQLTPGTRATYERVARLKSGVALAEARNYSCTACRMTIRPQAFNEIRRGDSIYECENCGRILFFKTEATAT